jgi:hypothetical protein
LSIWLSLVGVEVMSHLQVVVVLVVFVLEQGLL